MRGGAQGAPPWLVVLALGYTSCWILAGFLSLLFDWSYLHEHRWIEWTSIALLGVSIWIVARGLGFIGTLRGSGSS